MPGNAPPLRDEREQLLAFIAQQRHVLRVAAHGLTDEQARATPTASALSVGGLLKHVAFVEALWVDRVAAATAQDSTVPALGQQDDAEGYAAYAASLVLGPEETLAGVLAQLDDVAARTEAVVRGADLRHPVALPDEPWLPDGDVPVRWVLLHLVEELARHAGHADVVREQLDGATALPLLAAAEGWPATPWVRPWRPGPSA